MKHIFTLEFDMIIDFLTAFINIFNFFITKIQKRFFKTSMIGDLGFVPSPSLDPKTMRSQVLVIKVN